MLANVTWLCYVPLAIFERAFPLFVISPVR